MVESFLDHIRYRYDRAVSNWVIEVSFFLNNAPYYEGTGYSAVDAWKCKETVHGISIDAPTEKKPIGKSLKALFKNKYLLMTVCTWNVI